MRSLFYLLVICLFLSCTNKNNDRILVPKLQSGFYSKALEEINDALNSDPDNNKLVDQKLFYCEQLDWPISCLSALDRYKEVHGMTLQLVEQYVNYHNDQQSYNELIKIIERWDQEYDLVNRFMFTYIDALTRSNQNLKAKAKLISFLDSHSSFENNFFASQQYLRMNDTLLAAYMLGRVYRADPKNDLMWEYGNILMDLGYTEKGFAVLNDYAILHPEDFEVQLQYALRLEQVDRISDAKNTLKPFYDRDTVAYLLSKWYQDSYQWDSSAYVLNNLFERDSTKREPIWRLGRLYEDRGWYTTAIPYFQRLTTMNRSDTLAERRIALIQRKIAYLQRLKSEEEKLPELDLQPKKLEN